MGVISPYNRKPISVSKSRQEDCEIPVLRHSLARGDDDFGCRKENRNENYTGHLDRNHRYFS